MSPRTSASVVILGLAISWGFISILVREVDLPALTLVFWRVALAAAAIALGVVVTGRRDLLRVPRPAVLALGLLLAAHWATYFGAIKETSVASANVITYANPILMAFIAPWLLGERVGPVTVAALGVSVVGIVVIGVLGPTGGSGAVRPLGLGLAGASAISYAFLITCLKRWGAGTEPVRLVLWQAIVAAVVLSPFAVTADHGGLDARDWLYLLLLGVVLTGLSGLVYVSALRSVPATDAGILAYMEPVSAALLAVALIGEQMTWAIALGGALIVAAGITVIVAGPGPQGGSVQEPVASRMARART
jgi:DME family drug/metabolite transporter